MEEPAFRARAIDDDARLLEESYRLRYQVYCVERQFLDAAMYPDQRETDEFDDYSVHVGAVDAQGELAATARGIRANPRGFPMLRHCAFYPEVQTFDSPQLVLVEASRVSISRNYQRRRGSPLIPLVKAVMQAAKRLGATHLIGANEAAFHRWLVHYGLPYRIAGPVVDYYGPVVPCVMSLHELDEVVIGGRFPALDGFPIGWDPERWPGYYDTPAGVLSC